RSFLVAPYRSAWIRLWSRGSSPFWRVDESRTDSFRHPVSRDPDGVVFYFRTGSKAQYAIQVGGPAIPWKFVGVPADSEVALLVRPVSILDRRTHPLEVLVASGTMEGAALLTLLGRGQRPGL